MEEPTSNNTSTDGIEQSDREANSWETVQSGNVRISLEEGNIRISDSFEDARLMAQPCDVDFSLDENSKPGEVRFSFGSESHGFAFDVPRRQFERIISACCDEWGYDIQPVGTGSE